MANECVLKIGEKYFLRLATRPYGRLVNNAFNATKYYWGDRFQGTSDAEHAGFELDEIEFVEFNRYAKHEVLPEDEFVFSPKRMTEEQFENTLDEIFVKFHNAESTWNDLIDYLIGVMEKSYEGNRIHRLDDFWQDGTRWIKATLQIEEIPSDALFLSMVNRYADEADELENQRLWAFEVLCDALTKMKRLSNQSLRKRLLGIIGSKGIDTDYEESMD